MPTAAPDQSLLSPADGPAVAIIRPAAQGPFVFVCEHASNRIPAALQSLGLDPDDLQDHIAWDPGALAVATALSEAFDSPLVAARFSRLVYDCNRPPIARTGIAEISEDRVIPGNRNLSAHEVGQRIAQIYRPFADAVAKLVERRLGAGPAPILVSIHSFTPIFLGRSRSVEVGILHDRDTRFADVLLDHATTLANLDVRRNEPYGPGDGVTHTLQTHALSHGLLNAMIEIRNDLLADPAAVQSMADMLADCLQQARLDARLAAPENQSAKASG